LRGRLRVGFAIQTRDCVPILPSAGDEANAIATAPSIAKVEQSFPLVRPDTFDNQDDDFNVIDHWGNLSPFKSVASFGLPNASAVIPAGYTLTQIHLLHRHGARYPTSGSGPASFAAEIHAAATGSGFNATGPLDFMNTWTYKLGAEILSTCFPCFPNWLLTLLFSTFWP